MQAKRYGVFTTTEMSMTIKNGKLLCGALFVVSYSMSFAYFFYADKSSPSASSVGDAKAEHLLAVESRPVTPIVPKAESRVETRSISPTMNVVAARPMQQLADTPAPLVDLDQDDLSALMTLMSDPDPEVARVARDAYQARQEGR